MVRESYFNMNSDVICLVVTVFAVIGVISLITTFWIRNDNGPVGPSDMDCGNLPEIEHGDILYLNWTTSNSEVSYICDEDYKLSGPPRRKCLKGSWSGTAPKCIATVMNKEIRCGEPETGEGLSVNVSSYAPGEVARYSCAKGLTIIEGDSNHVCLRTGQWMGKKPKCSKILCTDLDEAGGGLSFHVLSNSVGSVAQYSCVNGLSMDGNSTLECLESGEWSARLPECYSDYVWNATLYECMNRDQCYLTQLKSNRCTNLDSEVNDLTVAIDSHNTCVRLYQNGGCKGKVVPLSTKSTIVELRSYNFLHKLSSIGPCY